MFGANQQTTCPIAIVREFACVRFNTASFFKNVHFGRLGYQFHTACVASDLPPRKYNFVSRKGIFGKALDLIFSVTK